MDILHPNAPALPHLERSTGQAAIDEANDTLEKWHKNSTTWACRANKAHDETRQVIKDFRNHGVHYDENLHECLPIAWTKIGHELEVLQEELQQHHKRLLQSKANIMAAQGDSGVTGSWLGMRTPDQKQVHQEYTHRLRKLFEQAEHFYEEMTATPEGVLAQIVTMHKKFNKEQGMFSNNFQ